MLTMHALTKRYGRRLILDRISGSVPGGSITALLGPNGAGKSTLLHTVVGLLQADGGRVTVTGRDGAPGGPSCIGFCPDDLPMPELLTGNEYLALATGVRKIAVSEAAQQRLMRGLRLEQAADALITTYSHGMRRKIQLIAALLHVPSVLILDEPFRGLDPESSAIMKHLLRTYAERGNAVLMSTHDLLVADQLCDRVLVLDRGRIRADQDLATLRSQSASASLEEAFLAMTGIAEEATHAAADFFSGLETLTDEATA